MQKRTAKDYCLKEKNISQKIPLYSARLSWTFPTNIFDIKVFLSQCYQRQSMPPLMQTSPISRPFQLISRVGEKMQGFSTESIKTVHEATKKFE